MTARSSYGTALQYSSDDSSYTQAGKVKKITGPTIKGGAVDITHLLSPNRCREFTPGLLDPGDLKFTLLMESSNPVWGLRGALYFWKIIFPQVPPEAAAPFWKVLGFLNEFSTSFEEDAGIIAEAGIKFSGLPVWTDAT